MKVTGVINPETGKKDFMIQHDGQTYMAKRHGSMFRCEGYTGTLKSIKQRILHPVENKDILQHPTTEAGTFDCIHPCALLIKIIPREKMPAEVIRTLECYGWLDEDGDPDFGRTNNEINLNIQKGTAQ